MVRIFVVYFQLRLQFSQDLLIAKPWIMEVRRDTYTYIDGGRARARAYIASVNAEMKYGRLSVRGDVI